MKLTDLPLDRPVATVMLLVCLTVLGTVAIFQLPLGFMPPVAEPEVTSVTSRFSVVTTLPY